MAMTLVALLLAAGRASDLSAMYQTVERLGVGLQLSNDIFGVSRDLTPRQGSPFLADLDLEPGRDAPYNLYPALDSRRAARARRGRSRHSAVRRAGRGDRVLRHSNRSSSARTAVGGASSRASSSTRATSPRARPSCACTSALGWNERAARSHMARSSGVIQGQVMHFALARRSDEQR